MKKGFTTILAFVLMVAVLFASTGIVIAEHICLKKKVADVTLFQQKKCCSKHEKDCTAFPVVKKNCCQLNISYHKLEVNTSVKSAASYPQLFLPVLAFLMNDQLTTASPVFSMAGTDPPDHPHLQQPGSKTFIHSIHSLLI